MIHTVCRQSWLAVCLLSALMTGLSASAQFLDADIIASQEIDAEMRQKMIELVAPAITKMTSHEPADVSSGRQTLITPLRDASATAAFKDSLSELITARIAPAVDHETVLVRINAMILLANMTDEKSEPFIDKGLKDDNIAVQRKAGEALHRRIRQHLMMPANNRRAQRSIAEGIEKIDTQLSKTPALHPIVVRPLLLTLLDIGITSDPQAHLVLTKHLNNRVAIHAQTPGLGFDGEVGVISQTAVPLSRARPFPAKLGSDAARAAFRFAKLTATQLLHQQIPKNDVAEAVNLLSQSLQAMQLIVGGADQKPAQDHRNMLSNKNWDGILKLLDQGWKPILQAHPFLLTAKQLDIGSPIKKHAH